MKHTALLIALTMAAAVASADNCYIRADDGSCLQRFWKPLDTTVVTSRPIEIQRLARWNGVRYIGDRLVLSACYMIGGAPNQECGGIPPEPVTLRQWCAAVMRLPVPARIAPPDSVDYYGPMLQEAGVCP